MSETWKKNRANYAQSNHSDMAVCLLLLLPMVMKERKAVLGNGGIKSCWEIKSTIPRGDFIHLMFSAMPCNPHEHNLHLLSEIIDLSVFSIAWIFVMYFCNVLRL